MELIRKALPGSQLAVKPSLAKTETRQSVTNSGLQVVQQQEGIPHDWMTMNDKLRQQAEELFTRVSQQREMDEPLQKLSNALYTCDPHRTGRHYILEHTRQHICVCCNYSNWLYLCFIKIFYYRLS